MSATELYLRECAKLRGTWHKVAVSNLREYLAKSKEDEIISAINKITDATLLPFLWEVGISQTLQDVANKRSIKLAGSKQEEVK